MYFDEESEDEDGFLEEQGMDFFDALEEVPVSTALSESSITSTLALSPSNDAGPAEEDETPGSKRRRLKEMALEINSRSSYVNQRNYNMQTALHYAAREGHLECVDLLLGAGAEVDARDSEGRTPLHYAAERGRVDVLLCLHAVGGSLGIQDDSGHTALDLIAQETLDQHRGELKRVIGPLNWKRRREFVLFVSAHESASTAGASTLGGKGIKVLNTRELARTIADFM